MRSLQSGSTFPACHFANLHQLLPPLVRLFGSTTLDRFAPGSGPLPCLKPVAVSTAGSLNRAADRRSSLGFLGPSGSVRLPASRPNGPPSESARSPLAPRGRSLLLGFRLRIIVPGPLRFRRPAVPQTSWNLPQYALYLILGQRFFGEFAPFSSKSFCQYFEPVTAKRAWNICE